MNKARLVISALVLVVATTMTAYPDSLSQVGYVVVADAPTADIIYVADSDDDCPVNDKVPLSVELQEYIWKLCKSATDDYENYYCFILGVLEHESTFRIGIAHKNKNGSVDRGIGQINSCHTKELKKLGLISSTDDLFDPYINLTCSFYLMNQYIEKFGVSESAYYAYNTGKGKTGSNSNSRKVMKYMVQWKSIIFGG